MASEEAKVAAQDNTEVLTAYNRIPYALINAEVEGPTKDTLTELTQICDYYKVYKKGADFNVEGTNGWYWLQGGKRFVNGTVEEYHTDSKHGAVCPMITVNIKDMNTLTLQ